MATDQRVVSMTEIQFAADHLARRWRDIVERSEVTEVSWVPRGGVVPASMVATMLHLPLIEPGPAGEHDATTLVVDDLVDSGATFTRIFHDHIGRGARPPRLDALYRKPHSPTDLAPNAIDVGVSWLVFPWERVAGEVPAADAVTRLLEVIGEDPARDGLLDTPARVVKALSEMTSGYADDPAVILARHALLR